MRVSHSAMRVRTWEARRRFALLTFAKAEQVGQFAGRQRWKKSSFFLRMAERRI